MPDAIFFYLMTTMFLIAGGIWMVVAFALGLALCMVARRSMPEPTQEAMQPQLASRVADCSHEPAFAASASRHHA